ncbi:glycosyltransferase family 2 protein [Arthrobacter sp. BL-252-APC-1A]|uniref:glycosyltransferase family 2 protein n=1 Tax=Arthrobacter sp. BL-252-APC-1A TaxID=2606622 RepID=UPI0012B2220A|nr:glycosyltransferase family 2 protein [Arthrobacter sp. BL-252-APC-1A]MSS00023.1 glycosyltransferase family 2 protein [Arthrobacter sp. BL-252-APC-1A]
MNEQNSGAAGVAIITRTKNRPVLLRRAVADVLAQQYTDWHLVVVNDGGDAAEVDRIIAEAPGLEGRVTVLHHAASAGMEAASNAGIAASDSEFLAIHDDDDTWHPEFLARTVEYLGSHADDVGVGVRTEIVLERTEGSRILETGRVPFAEDVDGLFLGDALRYNRCVPISLLYRRDIHGMVGGYDESLAAVGDWEFLIRLLQNHSLGFLDGEPLAYWHHREGAEGEDANSVLAGKNDHRRFDKLVRDRHLQEYIKQNGIGGLLFLTGELKQQADHLHQRLNYSEEILHELRDRAVHAEERMAALEAAVSDASLVSLLRRRYRSLKDRLRRR